MHIKPMGDEDEDDEDEDEESVVSHDRGVRSECDSEAGTITFNDDPFAGSTALTTAGRQVVGNELFTNFDVANDTFKLDESVFGVGQLNFANGEIGDIPSAGTNFAVLRTFDNDADPATPFGAGNAANLLADQITTPGAGFFVYFNSGLDLARLVFSTDLSDATADLKVLARLTNFTGEAGREAMATISTGNFAVIEANPVPLPGTLAVRSWPCGFGFLRP